MRKLFRLCGGSLLIVLSACGGGGGGGPQTSISVSPASISFTAVETPDGTAVFVSGNSELLVVPVN